VKRIAVLALAVCSLIGSSCATLLKGTKEEITVVSDPSGAEVTVNESREGATPVSFTVPSKEDLNITVTKAGYQPEDLQDPTSFRWGYEAWAFIVYVIPMVVDLSDGAAWGHDHLTVTAHLEPNGQPTSAAETAPAAGAASDDQASHVAGSSPATRPEAIAAAPSNAPVTTPSTSPAAQPATATGPSLTIPSAAQ
jgi:PEGA domain